MFRTATIRKLALAILGLGLSGCGLLEIGPSSEITGIEPASVRVSVIELGPLNPGRVASLSDAPMSEFLPGDRVRFEIEVVDVDGLALADEQLDSVWLLLGREQVPLADPTLDLRCDELEGWTIDTPCRLGEGRGSIEFTAPPLGESLGPGPRLSVYAVIAWNGQPAEQCWTARRERDVTMTDCDFLHFLTWVGPEWWLLVHAASEGLTTWLPVEQFHPAVLLQEPNRAPQLDHLLVDSQALPVNDGVVGPVAVAPGRDVTLQLVEHLQLAQSYFFPLTPEGDLFMAAPERIETRVSTAGAIVFEAPVQLDPTFGEWSVPAATPMVIHVDEHAEPSIARVLLAIHDHRGAEQLVRVELEIQ